MQPGASLPHFHDLYLSGYGANGVCATPDTTWEASLMVSKLVLNSL